MPNRILVAGVTAMTLALGALPAAAEEATGATGGASTIMNVLPFALMFAVVYVLMVRPAQQQRQKQEQMLSGLRKDDEVVTQSGLIGRIVAIEDSIVTLELGDKVRVRMLRDRIVGPFTKPGIEAKAAPARRAARPS